MPVGLRIRVVNTQDGSVIDRTFDRSPVRIGRSPLNELELQLAFVSQYHAVLEFDGRRIMLRDLGSKNGTTLRASGRVPPNAPVDLTGQNYEFAIVSLWFQLFFVTEVPVTAEKKREGTVLSLSVHQLLAQQAQGGQSGAVDPAPRATGPDRTPQLAARMQPLYEQYRASWAKLYQELQAVMNPLEPGARRLLLEEMSSAMGAVRNEEDFKRLSSYHGVAAPGEAGEHTVVLSDQHVALQALRDLATYYVPQRGQIERPVDVVAFAQRIQDVLDVFFKCFLPLRDGHKQFKTHLDIRHAQPLGEPQRAARAVETAREPRELAAQLLDWGDASTEGPRAVESTFAEVMVHQVAMLSGVMRGVRSLLQKLAPQSVEAELENPRRRAAAGIQLGPFRYKALWDLYAEVYGDFAEDEKQAFALIFGPEFAHAYSELAADAAPTGPQAGAGSPRMAPAGGPSPQYPQPPQSPGATGSHGAQGPRGSTPPDPRLTAPQPPWPGQWPGTGGPPRR